jgi:hypothetical protein
MRNKRGDYKYYLLASLIVGLLVLSLSLYFLFREYFTEDDTNWEVCRQSLILRNSMPEEDLKAAMVSGKGSLPLKCVNSVIDIDYENVNRAEKEVANAIGNCWYLSGRGEYMVFPGSKWTSTSTGNHSTPCMVCSRISISPDYAEFYSSEENRIDIESALSSNYVDRETNFWNYLNPLNGAKAFMYFNGWSETGFEITPYNAWTWGGGITKGIPDDARGFRFPKYLDPNKGDLYVLYVEPAGVLFSDGHVRDIKPYMILIQRDDLNKLYDIWANYGAFAPNVQVCSSVESVNV